MQSQSNSQQNIKRSLMWLAWGPEAALYFLLGLAAFGLGTVASLRWAFDSWQHGARLPAICIISVAVLVPIAFVLLVRRQRRILAVGTVMLWLGVVAFALASIGFSLPAAWFG